MISRRGVLGAAGAFAALAGCRSAGELFASRTPRLKFGVGSDIHCQYRAFCDDFELSLGRFRDAGVDAVVLAGDLADMGNIRELKFVADCWRRVFPGDRAPDGRRVERVFVTGNHDVNHLGPLKNATWLSYYNKDAARITADAMTLRPGGIAQAWEECFGEKYEQIYRKTVKGYDFIGGHWGDWSGVGDIEGFMRKVGPTLDPSKPFFYVQHPHPQNTCYGKEAWGRDAGATTRALSAFPNAIAFSGHSHYTLTDERSIWQGAFTSLGTASLRYTSIYQVTPLDKNGYVNRMAPKPFHAQIDPHKLMPAINTYYNRQGMLVSVYSDYVVFARREFMTDQFLGPDWVMPLPNAEPRPFSIASRAAKSPAPAFPSGAQLSIKRLAAKPRGGKGVPKKPVPAVEVSFPAATAVAGTRPFEYEIRAEPKTGDAKVWRILSPGYHYSPEHARAKGPASCTLPVAELPQNVEFRFVVTPVSCFAKRGIPLSGTYLTV